jgi:hypothetical protein
MEATMDESHLDAMVQQLKPVLKDPAKAKTILQRYWRNKMALVWATADVHRAANERAMALTEKEAMEVLATLHRQHNPQYGIKWEDLTTHIEDHGLGRKLTRTELKRFVERDIITVQK